MMSENTDPGPADLRSDFWDAARSYQRVALRDLRVTMRVGIAAIERKQLEGQTVIVNVEMFAHKDAHKSGDIADCINYHPVHEHIAREWPNRPHTDLLETLAEELVGVCFRDPKVEACRVSVQKPEIYDDTGAAMVEFYRRRPPG